MHAICMFYLYVSLGMAIRKQKISFQIDFFEQLTLIDDKLSFSR